ncbi:MAG TPA: type II toxin-antitoxin system RelE/ParE family toxin [Kiritimatiellia bacterium]|jgi:putative addiction module killer protein
MTAFTLREYVEDHRSPYAEWFDALEAFTAARVDKHVRRMEQGNFGDSKSVGAGVMELRIDFGPGLRVYYGRDGMALVILLAGGSKKSQSRDIAEAIRRWQRHKQRKKEEQEKSKKKGA